MEVWLIFGVRNMVIINREPTDDELDGCAELFRISIANKQVKPEEIFCDYFPDHENLEATDEVARRFHD